MILSDKQRQHLRRIGRSAGRILGAVANFGGVFEQMVLWGIVLVTIIGVLPHR
jgi:hypothetical protein